MNNTKRTILADKVAEFSAAIVAINKRAIKLGVDKITADFGEVYEVKHIILNENSSLHSKVILVPVVDVVLNKPSINLEGWLLLGNIKHDIDTGLVLLFGDTKLLGKYANVEPTRCDHCNTKHKRVKQFLVSKDGVEKVVGHSCLKDFVGNELTNANNLWKFICDLEAVFPAGEEDEFGLSGYGGGVKLYYSVKQLLVLANDEIGKNGFVSVAQGQESNIEPTRSIVQSAYDRAQYLDVLQADNIIAEFLNLSEDDDSAFVENLKSVIGVTDVSHKHIGLVVYIPEYIRRINAKNKENVNPSEFVGEVGERCDFSLIVDNILTFESQYGYTFYVIFVDDNNNKVLWKTTGKKGLAKGDRVDLVVRVKGHDNSKYGKQTVITRPTINNIVKCENLNSQDD